MKICGALLGGFVALLLVPVLAIGALAGVIFPATTASSCTAPVTATSGMWRPPLLSRYVITSGFGMRYHPVLHATKLHTGIDLVATGDKTIVAAADGTVKTRGYNIAYGNQIVIDNGGGIWTRYAHMASPSPVAVGQKIDAGTTLGTQGATGYVTGAHLHFEVILNGHPINPRPFMAAHGAPLNGDAAKGQRPAPGAQPAVAMTGTTLTATRTDGRKITLGSGQLAHAATIIGVGHEVGAGDRGVVVALMAALQESMLQNLNYGDRDSLGLFQQRTGWGTNAQRRTPEWSARAFFGGPNGPNHGSPAGLLDIPGWKSLGLGQAAQAVQVSAYPNAYDGWEPVARAILARQSGGTGAGGCEAAGSEAGGSAYGQLRVLTWNVCLEFCGGGKLPRSWVVRIPMIATMINQAHPDVIALQETGKQTSQAAAIIRALAPRYKLAVYKRSQMLLCDPTKLSTETANGGSLQSAKFVVEGKGGVAQVFRDRRTNTIIVVSSLHPNDGTNDERRLRYITRAFHVVTALGREHPGSVIVQAGDLNSYIPGRGTKKNIAEFFATRGYRSSEQIAQVRTGYRYKSYNGGHAPTRGARIDHVIVDPRTVSVPRWQQVLVTHQESDHHMIWADLKFSGTKVATLPVDGTLGGA